MTIIPRIKNFIQCRKDNYNLWKLKRTIQKNVDQPTVLFDIGCGDRPQEFIQASNYLVLADPQTKEETVIHERIIDSPCLTIYKRKADWAESLNLIEWVSGGFDITVCLMDVIEHLEKPTARFLLEKTEKIADQIVIFTPLGFMPQQDGEFNSHRSGWVPEDFARDGWKVWIFKNFHHVDFKGRELTTPHSAMLAVYKKCQTTK